MRYSGEGCDRTRHNAPATASCPRLPNICSTLDIYDPGPMAAHSGGSAGSAADALWMIGVIEADRALARSVRRQATDLRDLVGTDPDLARSRLLALATTVAPALPRHPPTADLARCTGIEGFYERYLARDVRAFFRTPEDYRRHIESSGAAGPTLADDLATVTPLIPAIHSWMTKWAEISGFSGRDIRRYLNIRPLPPIVILVMRLRDLRAAGITVREPRAVDALPKHLTEWSPGGLRSGGTELIDGDMPRAAVSTVEWRP
jgi:hypothetical protein